MNKPEISENHQPLAWCVLFVCFVVNFSPYLDYETLYIKSKHQVQRKSAILKQSAIETANINKYI